MSKQTAKHHVLHESLRESIISDVSTLITTVFVIGIGVFLGSSAMQWAGFIMLAVTVLVLASGKRSRGRSPQHLADYLYEEYGVVAQEGEEDKR